MVVPLRREIKNRECCSVKRMVQHDNNAKKRKDQSSQRVLFRRICCHSQESQQSMTREAMACPRSPKAMIPVMLIFPYA